MALFCTYWPPCKRFGGVALGSIQPGAAKAVQIMLAVGVVPDRHVLGDPGQRDIRLGAAEFQKRSLRNILLSRHARGGGQHAMCADEVAALAQRLARQPDRFVIVPAQKLGVGGDAVIDRRIRIAWAQSQGRRAASSPSCQRPL